MKKIIFFLFICGLNSCEGSKTAQSGSPTSINTQQQLEEIKSDRNATDIKMVGQRYKNCEKGKVIKKPGTFDLSIDGLDFFVKNQKIVGVAKMTLKQDVLEAITEKFAIIDDYLYSNCIDLSREYNSANPDKTIISKMLDQKEKLITTLSSMVSQIKETATNNKDQDKLKASLDSTKTPNLN